MKRSYEAIMKSEKSKHEDKVRQSQDLIRTIALQRIASYISNSTKNASGKVSFKALDLEKNVLGSFS